MGKAAGRPGWRCRDPPVKAGGGHSGVSARGVYGLFQDLPDEDGHRHPEGAGPLNDLFSQLPGHPGPEVFFFALLCGRARLLTQTLAAAQGTTAQLF